MRLGEPLELFPDWRLVEADLYDITGRVREYDPDARLVVNADGEIGLARWDRHSRLIPGGALIFCRECVDWSTPRDAEQTVLTGTPDARVLWDQRVSDAHRIRHLPSWNRAMRDRRREAEYRRTRERREWSADMAEQFVNIAQRKDLGRRPVMRVPRAIA